MGTNSTAAVPQRVGRYELRSRLQGVARPVFLGEDPTTEETVTIRLLTLSAGADPCAKCAEWRR